jgi:3-hydroxyisobutyrate dehydrogenase-like beta-hydroxyacid dehydrogenase
VVSNNNSSGEKTGIIGIGLAGIAIAETLLKAGYKLVGYDIRKERMELFAGLGGITSLSLRDVAADCPRIILSLFDTKTVKEVIFGENGLLTAPSKPRCIIDTTTGDPEETSKIAEDLAAKGIAYMDATLSGSSEQIRNRQAVFMVGGNEKAFSSCRDIFDAVSEKTFYLGAPGNGSKAKLATNLVLGLNRLVLAEGLHFAGLIGLDIREFLPLLKATPAYSVAMDVKGEKMLNEDYTPQSKVSQHYKDLVMIQHYANIKKESLPLAQIHQDILKDLIDEGNGEKDSSFVFQYLKTKKSE